MSAACCHSETVTVSETVTASETVASATRCPRSGTECRAVGWRTVAALVNGPLPPPQTFRICLDPDCEVVYFGSAGTVIGRGDLRFEVGFKTGSAGQICYCFGHSRADVEAEMALTGKSEIVSQVEARGRAKGCACEVRNPTGKCCLRDLRAAAAQPPQQS